MGGLVLLMDPKRSLVSWVQVFAVAIRPLGRPRGERVLALRDLLWPAQLEGDLVCVTIHITWEETETLLLTL